MHKLITLLLLTFSLAVYAGAEEDVSCDLEKAKAEVLAATVESPYVYGGVSSAANDKAVTLGAGYSLSGRSKGKLIRQAADAKCGALAATLQLDEAHRWSLVSAVKAGAKVELVALIAARKTAADQALYTQKQLQAQTLTLAEYMALRQVQAAIDQRIAAVKLVLSQPSNPTALANLRSLLATAKVNLARAAELEAQVQTESAWDVTAVAGARSPLGPGAQAQPFVGLTFKWSFGSSAANAAVATVKAKTAELFDINSGGYAQTMSKLTAQVVDILAIEQERSANLELQLADIRMTLVSMRGLETALATSAKRSLELQVAVQQAEQDGVKRRIVEYQALLSRF